MRVTTPSCVVISKAASLGWLLGSSKQAEIERSLLESLGSQAEDAIRTNVVRRDARIAEGLVASNSRRRTTVRPTRDGHHHRVQIVLMANQEHKEWLLWLDPDATVLSGLIVLRLLRERRSGHVGVASARNVSEKALPPRLTVHGQADSRPSRRRSRQALPWHQFMGCSGLAGQGPRGQSSVPLRPTTLVRTRAPL